MSVQSKKQQDFFASTLAFTLLIWVQFVLIYSLCVCKTAIGSSKVLAPYTGLTYLPLILQPCKQHVLHHQTVDRNWVASSTTTLPFAFPNDYGHDPWPWKQLQPLNSQSPHMFTGLPDVIIGDVLSCFFVSDSRLWKYWFYCSGGCTLTRIVNVRVWKHFIYWLQCKPIKVKHSHTHLNFNHALEDYVWITTVKAFCVTELAIRAYLYKSLPHWWEGSPLRLAY